MNRTVLGVFACAMATSPATAQAPDSTLHPVQVTATRIPGTLPRVGRSLQVVDSLLLHAQARPEVSEVLRMATLVDVRQRGPFDVQTDLGIRGGTFDQALVLVDGVPMNDLQTGHLALDLPVDADALERVEVLYGGASRTFGPGAFSGAINLITRIPEDSRGAFTLDGGQYGSYRTRFSQDLLLGQTGIRIGGHHGHSDGYVANSDFDQYGALLDVNHRHKAIQTRVQAGLVRKRFGAQNFYSSAFPLQQEATGTCFASVGAGHDSQRWSWQTKAYFRQHDDLFELFREDDAHYRYAGGYFIRNGNDTARLAPSLFYTFHNRHRTQSAGTMGSTSLRWKAGTTAIGVHGRQDQLYSNVLGKPMAAPFRPAGGREMLDRADDRQNLALHADHRWGEGAWTVDAGVLFNINSRFAPEWAPGVDVVYRWANAQSLFASVGRAFRFPTWTDLYYNRGGAIGSATLQPEHADQAELGYRILRGRRTLKLAGWRRQGRDLIDWVQMPGEATTHAANLTEVDLNGIEAEAGLRTGSGRGGLLYAYQWADQGSFNFASLYVLDHLTHNAVLWWNQRLPKGFRVQANLGWRQRYGTYVRLSDGVSKAYPDPVRLDLKAEWERRGITLFASAYNLLGAEQMDRGNVPLPGRWLSGGLRVAWDTNGKSTEGK